MALINNNGIHTVCKKRMIQYGILNGSYWYYCHECHRVIDPMSIQWEEKLKEPKMDTWTVHAELTVFTGDMSRENVISNAEALLEDITEGTDFAGFTVTGAKRDE